MSTLGNINMPTPDDTAYSPKKPEKPKKPKKPETVHPVAYTDIALLDTVRGELGLNEAKRYATLNSSGLTKREWYAGLVLPIMAQKHNIFPQDAAASAVRYADALIAALNKGQ